MNNSYVAPPAGISRPTNKASELPSTTHDGSASHGSGSKSLCVKVRDKCHSMFCCGRSKDKAATLQTKKARLDIFSENVRRPSTRINAPKIGTRLSNTPQLALCSSLLLQSQTKSSRGEVHNGAQDLRIQYWAREDSQNISTDEPRLDWIKGIENDAVEQDHIRWLGTHMVEEFYKDAVKVSAAVEEVVLLGPFLDCEHYRKLLNCFISEFGKAVILDVHLLQSLIQLVQCAPEGYLVADDLVRILSMLRAQLQNIHLQSTEHPYHFTLAVSRLLDVMADNRVQNVKRVKDHEPLSKILSGLRSSSDPYLMFQASYAFQALQYVPDDETPLQAVLRHSAGVVESIVKISGVINLDLSSALDGLKGFQAALSSTYDAAKAGYEGVQSLKESGRGLLDSLKDGLSTGQKRLWYPALRVAGSLVQQGQLADLNRLIIQAPCRRDPLFQWGICQLLGEIAADGDWEVKARYQAMDLLTDLFWHDTEWAQDESVRSWMLALLAQLRTVSDLTTKYQAGSPLAALMDEGGSVIIHQYPLKARLPMPRSSPLLTRVQDIPNIHYKIHQLKRQRLEEEDQPVYIPPMAKSSHQASDGDAFPLMEKITAFLTSQRQVMLILGDSGAGKSTFNRHLECELWRSYTIGGKLPLFINLPALRKPENELIEEQLRRYNFSEPQIQELKLHRQLIVICDGYDESQLTTNLYTTNQLNRPGQWNVKLLVSCRSQYLGREYRDLFAPPGSDHYSAPALHLFQEAVITPFSRSQIEDYVEQYVPIEPRLWVTEDYMEKLTTIPNLMDLVTNPFLLILSLGALPSVVEGKKDLSTVRITRVALYDSFVEHWIGANKRRLQKQKLEQSSRTVLAELIEDDFQRNGVEYQKQLAAAIFKEQDGKPVVDYSHKRDNQSWKAKFFGPEPGPTLLRGCSLLNRVGNNYRFIHRSILEYFYARFVYQPSRTDDEFNQTTGSTVAAFVQLVADHPLSQRNIVSEPSIIQFLCERVKEDLAYKEQLLALIELSKTDPKASQAASNAITILVRSGVMFNGADLQGVQIPGADLSGGQFDSAQLQSANMRNTNLRNIWLRRSDLSEAQMEGAQFGEWPFLEEDNKVESCAFSPDGAVLAVGLKSGKTRLYKTATWAVSSTLEGHSSIVTSVAFSSTGQEIASGSNDMTVRLWNAQIGTPGTILRGHERVVSSVVFSPSGKQIASGSWDCIVRLWDVQTGKADHILIGHNRAVTSVAFSQSGQQIASGSDDHAVKLWHAQTGALLTTLTGHTNFVTSITFSPSGELIASGSKDMTVRLWDVQTGTPRAILGGHTSRVRSVVFSPSGQHIASGSDDKTVRLWDAQTGAPGAILGGHTDIVTSVVFSPSGEQIASGSDDKTVRLWGVQASAPGAIPSGHISLVVNVMFSPSDKHIASGSYDKTMRIWDAQSGVPGVVLNGHTGEVTAVAFSPKGQQIASGSSDNTVRLWNAETGVQERVLSDHASYITCVVFSPKGQQIASASFDGTVRLWNTQTGGPGAVLTDHTDSVTSVAFSPSGSRIASGSEDMTVRLWNALTGAPHAVLIGHGDFVTSVVFSPTGQQLASGSDDYTVRLWNGETGVLSHILRGHTSGVIKVVFSPNGHQIASSSRDNTVRLWDAETGAPGAVLSDHTASVTSLVFSSSSQEVVTGGKDKTVRLWDVKSSRCLTIVRDFHDTISSIAWNNGSSNYFATGCGDGSVRLWQVEGDRDAVRLCWSSTSDQLVMSDAKIFSAQGLSPTDLKLLAQRGAIVQPMLPKEP